MQIFFFSHNNNINNNYCLHRASSLFLSWASENSICREVSLKNGSFFGCFSSSQSLPRSTPGREVKWWPKIWSENFVSAKIAKVWFFLKTLYKGMAVHLLEFLNTLESATSWLDFHDCCVWGWPWVWVACEQALYLGKGWKNCSSCQLQLKI